MDNPSEETAEITPRTDHIGIVTAASGARLVCGLPAGPLIADTRNARPVTQIGALVRIPTATTMAFGFIDSIAFVPMEQGGGARAEINLLGELPLGGGAFVRGISVYPVLGAAAFAAGEADMAAIYGKPDAATLAVGTLRQFPGKTAYLKSEPFFARHSAIVGTTGAGKSCALALILRALLDAHPHGHVLLLDPHGEYRNAFGTRAHGVTPESLRLPYWLFAFDEIVEIFCSREPLVRAREAPILKDAILHAKREFAGVRAPRDLTVDTPVPYLIDDVLTHISDAMGKLMRADTSLPYIRLISTVEGLMRDRRYQFMFAGMPRKEDFAAILAELLRVPVAGQPLTVLDISGVPSEIVNMVVALLCRLVFDFAVQAGRSQALPVMVACDEAHRYIPRDDAQAYEPARRSIARLAKEGRKYGISLCLVTQRPSELSEAILSQCGTVIALRMSNREDQDFVARLLPDSAAGLLNMLPTLAQQEAVMVGEGVAHPMRVRFADLEPQARPRTAPTNFPQAWDSEILALETLAGLVRDWQGG